MTSRLVALQLEHATQRLGERLATLDERLRQGDEAAWGDYLATLTTLTAVLAHLTPGAKGELMTTKQMAERLGISPKTLLRRKATGEVRPALQLGQRGRAALRWRGDEVGR